MENGPTMTKLLILLAVLTTIYILISLPLFTAAYMAIKSGNLSKFTTFFTKKLSLKSV